MLVAFRPVVVGRMAEGTAVPWMAEPAGPFAWMAEAVLVPRPWMAEPAAFLTRRAETTMPLAPVTKPAVPMTRMAGTGVATETGPLTRDPARAAVFRRRTPGAFAPLLPRWATEPRRATGFPAESRPPAARLPARPAAPGEPESEPGIAVRATESTEHVVAARCLRHVVPLS